MADWQLRTPVAFIIFNRPDTTERVFREIARARPSKLLVIGDGPRPDRPGEAERVAVTRAIIERVDWDCEVLTNFSEVNLGCKRRVSSGIDWVFEQVEEAIILEDDCLPEPSFFRFCDEMLERYRDDERVALISGDNFQFGRKCGEASYYFSRYVHIWGWASWRRAWRHYDREARVWPAFRDGDGLLRVLGKRPHEIRYWSNIMDVIHAGKIDTWDYQWVLTVWARGMVSVLPQKNLISNIGFGVDATHTHGTSVFANMVTEPMSFPLRHPHSIEPNRAADDRTANQMFSAPLLQRIGRKIISTAKALAGG